MLDLGHNTDGRVNWPGVRVLGNHNQALIFTASYFLDADSWIPTRGVPYDRDGESRTTPRNGVAVGNSEGGVIPEGKDCVRCCFGFSCGSKGGRSQNGEGNGEGVAVGNGEGVATENGEGNDEGVAAGNGEGVVDPEEEDCVGCCFGFSCGPKSGGNHQGVSSPHPPPSTSI
ncbi:hypothetical protein KIW84_058425 [Lathyrus oleraceus]|uniref:Uncharacterized protein n=1 Tax=Pisum sativum TaxID=3888 RepID=A0A9D4X3W8_PEA|nr:hypothetical protein KIW84_058425 [Pisum sativum]